MPDIRIGSRIRDNDPRMAGRVLVVTEFATKPSTRGGCPGGVPNYVPAVKAYAKYDFAHVHLYRIHTDGKPRCSGWSLVQEGDDV